jgi:hypothetical protein
MKQFNQLREQTLEEKLKASDPAGKYVSDFVHSDNPKFAGKPKAKRIQMALAASYAAKGKSRNEEVEQQDEGILDNMKKIGNKVSKALTGGNDQDQLKDLQRKMGVAQTGKKPQMKEESEILDEAKPGLYANIHAKRKRIAAGSGERMRKPGSAGAPTADSFKDAAKTAKK